jgi:hypothetical protein
VSGTTGAGNGQVLAGHMVTAGATTPYFPYNTGRLTGGSDTVALFGDSLSYIAGLVLEPETGYAHAGKVLVLGEFGMFMDGGIVQADNQRIWENIVDWTLCCAPFQRGDCNSDSDVDLGDVITTLMFVFGMADEPGCLDSCDANDDGAVDIGDPIDLLGTLFQVTPGPWPLLASCADDPTVDVLSCSHYDVCP